MNPNILALILSFTLVVIVIIASTFLQKAQVLSEEGARKFIHIGVSNWWFLVIYLFDNIYVALIPPVIFIILNYISYRMNLIKSMERDGKGNLGTVYFPISLLLLVIASFTFMNPFIGAVGILVLGYGDGMAAIFGKHFGKKRFANGKSFIGSLAMFVASALVTLILAVTYASMPFYSIVSFVLIIAVVATITELITPWGLDNILIPVIVSLVAYLLLLVVM